MATLTTYTDADGYYRCNDGRIEVICKFETPTSPVMMRSIIMDEQYGEEFWYNTQFQAHEVAHDIETAFRMCDDCEE